VSEGTPRGIPILLLLAIALVAATLVWLVVRRLLGPRPIVVAKAAREGRRHPWLRRRIDPELETGVALTAALAVIVAGGLVLAVLAVVVRRTDVLAGIDTAAADWGERHETAFSNGALHVVTSFGETWMAIAVGVIVALIDAWRTRTAWAAGFLLVAIGGDKLLTTIVKEIVDRARPTIEPVAATLGPSFPSGHSSTSAVLWAAVALVAVRWCAPRWRPALAAAAVGIAVAVATSRVLLDVHWLTDVIAGLALGWAWACATAVAFGGRLLRFGAAARAAQGRAQTRGSTSSTMKRNPSS
jgi:membrane-associated phospholipid phosphatase